MRLIITGIPGTGKTSLAQFIAKKWKLRYFNERELALQNKIGEKKNGELIIDLAELKRVLDRVLRKEKKCVIEGHLACEMRLNADRVVVLRCNPKALEKRLKKRKYVQSKVQDNVLAEALDHAWVNACENYPKGKIIQLDSTRQTIRALEKRMERKKSDRVDWRKELEELADKIVKGKK